MTQLTKIVALKASAFQFPPITRPKPTMRHPPTASKITTNKSTPKITHDDNTADAMRLIFGLSSCHVL